MHFRLQTSLCWRIDARYRHQAPRHPDFKVRPRQIRTPDGHFRDRWAVTRGSSTTGLLDTRFSIVDADGWRDIAPFNWTGGGGGQAPTSPSAADRTET